MALRLAAELAYKIAAAASILSALPEETSAQCGVPIADVGVLMMNGTDDPFVRL